MGSRHRALSVGLVVVVAVGLLALDLGVSWLGSLVLEAVGWGFAWILVPSSVAALVFGWILGRFPPGRLDAVVPWSIGLFLVLRVGSTMGGWGHGDVWTHVVGGVLMPVMPALSCWLGYRWATRRVDDR